MKRFILSLINNCAFSPHGSQASAGTHGVQDNLVIPDEHDNIDIKALQLSAEQGDADAQNTLGECYYYGWGMLSGEHMIHDMEKAFSCWFKAANQGNANAQRRLGECFWFGDGVLRNKSESFRWYQKAAEQGDAEAQYCLAFLYLHGIEVPRNKEEAIRLYQESAKQGFLLARKCLEELK